MSCIEEGGTDIHSSKQESTYGVGLNCRLAYAALTTLYCVLFFHVVALIQDTKFLKKKDGCIVGIDIARGCSLTIQ